MSTRQRMDSDGRVEMQVSRQEMDLLALVDREARNLDAAHRFAALDASGTGHPVWAAFLRYVVHRRQTQLVAAGELPAVMVAPPTDAPFLERAWQDLSS